MLQFKEYITYIPDLLETYIYIDVVYKRRIIEPYSISHGVIYRGGRGAGFNWCV